MSTFRRSRPSLRRLGLIVSALMMVLAIAGWVRSGFVGDEIDRTHRWMQRPALLSRTIGFRHAGGDFALFITREEIPIVLPPGSRPFEPWLAMQWSHNEEPAGPLHDRYRVARGPNNYGWGTWAWYTSQPSPTLLGRGWAIVLPYWIFALPAALAPAWWAMGLKRRRAARRRAAGCCPECGYDLRGTPDRCPECGWGGHVSQPA